MSKTLRTIAYVAVAVGIVATTGSVQGALAFYSAAQSIDTAVSQKKPALKGSVSQVVIGATMAVPYAMGRTYSGGMQVYDNSGDDNNKKRYQVMVVSAAGPIDSYESLLADYVAIPFSGEFATGWFADYMWKQTRLGTRPDTAVFDTAGMPNWTSDHKLSGYAAYRITMKFDKDGKRYASGVPQLGVVGKMVWAYDPRLDSTYPGGIGPQRWDDEATWAWSENPGLHGLTYARGRFIEKDAVGTPLVPPVKIVGAGLPKDSIDVASFVEMANLDDANEWVVGGTVYEGPDISKWDNLKRIMQAGGGKPIWAGGQLRAHVSAPRPSLFRIEGDDLAEGSIEVQAMKGWRERRNSIVPKYRAEDHKWEYVQGDAVTAATYLAEDGELKTEEVQFDLVQDKDQAAQLAAYEMVNAREFGPITVSVKPRLLAYRVGEAGTMHIPECGLFEQLTVITGRSVNPATGVVTLTLESETSAKHLYALGLTGTAPPTPVIRDSQELDESTAGGTATSAAVATSFPIGLTITVQEDGDIIISNHTRRYTDGHPDVAVTGATIASGLTAGEFRAIAYDDPDRVGGAVTYSLHADDVDARVSPTNLYRHYLGYAVVPTVGGGDSGGGVSEPPGGPCVTTDAMIMMADHSCKPAGDVAIGDELWTRDEGTLRWGTYEVQALAIVPDQEVFKVTISGRELRGTADHLVYLAPHGWTKLSDIGVPDGVADVVKITVGGAHTYVSNGILSHNIKATT